MQTMSKIDALILGILFGAIPILLCFLLLFIIASSADWTGDEFGPYALAASGAGLVIDIIFLKAWVAGAFRMSNAQLGVIYVFYSIGALGFGMGVPIFNFAGGLICREK
jgi:hypothetical protein